MPRPLAELVHPSWLPHLEPVEPHLRAAGDFLRAEAAAGRPWLPHGDVVLRAFSQPLDAVRVVVVGQDPYPTPGHAVGLSFSVAPHVRPVPRSLDNIFRELVDDLGVARPASGDLTPWAQQGVLLLNRVLTTRVGAPGSHRNQGWEQVTGAAVAAVAARGGPAVAVLWGRDAQGAAALMPGVPVVASAHPSPMSARSGFFGSRPFSRVNELLREAGAAPVDWRLP